MIIHRLQMQNFKSYNGLHNFGPFDTHFTCVIGPNGNGKSNIIDAVLFVFGFKSSKLRQDSLSSLIHKSAFARPEQATVSVIFIQQNCLIKVSRTVYKSGHSYYRLNEQKIGWGQLREKLISKNIDLNKNLFIILQGQVERLCQLSPQKMVEYLEYVSGSDQFKEPIDQLQKIYIEKSISKEEKRGSTNLKRKIFDSTKQRTIQQAAWIMMKQKVLFLQHLVLKKIFVDNNSTYESLKNAESEQLAICKKIQVSISAIVMTIRQKNKEIKSITGQHSIVVQQIQKLREKIELLSLKGKEINRELNYLIKDKQKKQTQKSRVTFQINQLAKISEQHQQLILKNSNNLERLRSCKWLNKLKVCLDLQQKLKNDQSQLRQLSAQQIEGKARLQIDKQKLKAYELKYKNNKEIIIKSRNLLKLRRQEAQQIAISLAENEQSLIQMERQMREKPNEKILGSLQKNLNEIRSANKIKAICSDIALVTLREIIIIDPLYADAVETILPHLDYFIVDNLKQAQEILEFLNKRKLGRMTVLIRQSINEAIKDIKIIGPSPKDTKFLHQVCRCTDQQAKNILIWALGSTLVTNKLDIAMKVAYYDEKRYRVITTNGEFIDSSGTITKLTLKNGREKQNQDMLVKKQTAVRRAVGSLQERMKELKQESDELQLTLLTVENQQRSLDGLDEIFLQELEAQLRQKQHKSAKLKVQITQTTDSIFKIKAKIQFQGFDINEYGLILGLIKQQNESQQKISKIQSSGNLLKTLTKKIEETNGQIQNMNKALEEKTRQKNAVQTEKLKIENQIQFKNAELQEVKYRKSSAETQVLEMEKNKANLEEQLGESNQKNSSNSREQLKKIRGKIRSVELQRLQLLSKLFQSIKEIKQFSFIVCKIFGKCPELIHQLRQKGRQIHEFEQEMTLKTIANQSIVVLGKNDYKFSFFLSQKECNFLFESLRQGNIYSSMEDIQPANSEADIIFQSLPTKQFKFAHSFQMEKTKHFQKQLTKGESLQFQLDFQLFEEYAAAKREFELYSEQLKFINAQLELLKGELIDLRSKRLNIFMTNFNQINVELNNIYMKLTGGRAEINLIDSMNPFEGVQFSVRPVNKSWKRVNLLSGGEKTFTSLALIFACEEIKKFPFYFMDEIDAALDYKNTTLLANYISSKKNTQHIVISLRKNMYQECHRIIGVYKVMDQSRTVEMSMKEINQSRNI